MCHHQLAMTEAIAPWAVTLAGCVKHTQTSLHVQVLCKILLGSYVSPAKAEIGFAQ